MTKEVDDCIVGDESEVSSESDNYSELLNTIKNEIDFSELTLLVPGGAGYIGSHTVIELIKSGFTNIVIIDSYINSSPKAIIRMKEILNNEMKGKKYNLIIYDLDIAEDLDSLHEICKKHSFFACLHFAGLKAVGESVAKPLEYYHNNLNSTINLLRVLPIYNCHNFLFSSSATVYGSEYSPINETADVGRGITNPYGYTKYFVEQILHDTANANADLNAVILRYFNPIGAHPSGLIGNDPHIPNNLMPYLLQVAVGRRPHLNVFGNNYDTVDGTGVRDYVHVIDIARGHVKALEMDIIPRYLKKEQQKKIENEYTLNTNTNTNNNSKLKLKNGHTKLTRSQSEPKNTQKPKTKIKNIVTAYNLGTGKGTSVLQLLHALEKAAGKKIPYKIMGRRPGDLATLTADCTLARKKLGWKAEYTINEACRDAWRWQSGNPMGFRDTKTNKEKSKTKFESNGNNNNKKKKNKSKNNNQNSNSKNNLYITLTSFFFMIVAIAAYLVMFQPHT